MTEISEDVMTPLHYHSLSPHERRSVREDYVQKQGGKCCHCGGDLLKQPPEHIQRKRLNMKLFPRSFLKHHVHLHHSHKNGMTIGAVHARCNGVLWQYYGE